MAQRRKEPTTLGEFAWGDLIEALIGGVWVRCRIAMVNWHTPFVRRVLNDGRLSAPEEMDASTPARVPSFNSAGESETASWRT